VNVVRLRAFFDVVTMPKDLVKSEADLSDAPKHVPACDLPSNAFRTLVDDGPTGCIRIG